MTGLVRSRFILGMAVALLLLAGCVSVPGAAPGSAPAQGQPAASEISVYIDSDTNISDWWSNTVKPAFEAAHPEYSLTIVHTDSGGGGNGPIAERAYAALATGDDPDVDYFEQWNVLQPAGALDDGLWQEITAENVPNIANVIDATNRLPQEIPYRGSQVLLAYNSDLVAEDEVPTTYAELIQWIQDHPGQFVYNRPDRGGSGAAMVTRAIFEVSGQDPSLFVPGEFDEELAAKFTDAWALLGSVHSSIYEEGSYPAGNTPVLELLMNGSVSMITAWSDQALQAINLGVLPETTKLAQLTDLPFTGGYSYSAIPSNSTNQEGALALSNFLLEPEMQVAVVEQLGGFPVVAWDTLPAELQEQYTDVITDVVPTWPGGDYGAAMVEGWYNNVATNIDPAS
jgi:putative spermidine/putrescine transport system substrate-binding protein